MVRRFYSDTRGNFGIIAALCALPVFGAGAFAVDYISAASYKAGVQDAIDAAVLSAAASKETTEAGMKAVAEKTLAGNLPADVRDTVFVRDFKYDKTLGTVTLEAGGQIPSLFANLFNMPVLHVSNISQAVRPSGTALEIALVLDNTYSMTAAAGGSVNTYNPSSPLNKDSSKLDHLKFAAGEMVDIFTNQPADLDVRFAVVPFSNYVNVGLNNRNKFWLDVPADSSTSSQVCRMQKPVISKSGCVTKTGTGTNDGTPTSWTYEECSSVTYGPEEEVCSTQTQTSTWKGCVGSRDHPFDMRDEKYNFRVPGLMNADCSQPILPLTADRNTVRSAIGGMEAQNDTYIPAGVMWGWRTLSQHEPFNEGKSKDDARKFMIIMTDGHNTLSPTYPWHWGDDGAEADKLMVEACSNAKDDGVEIFTVGVGITSASTKAGLAKCASKADSAILVENAAELEKVFTDIANEILRVRLTI